MQKFPSEFADILSARGRRILRDGWPGAEERFWHGNRTPIILIPDVIDRRYRDSCRRLLDEFLFGCVTTLQERIPVETITELKYTGLETLPKTLRLKTTHFTRSSKAGSAARDIGLIQMLTSPSLLAFCEAVTQYELLPDPGLQAILYRQGDHVGPHNDHHPELDNARDGYIDVHLMFSNEAVKGQSLVYEEDGYFQKEYDTTADGAVAISRLPFWHYTTPLRAKRGRESKARRWVLLATFDIVWASG